MNSIPMPLDPWSQVEKNLINKISTWPREKVLDELKKSLQAAILVEQATIPIYLYAYYSIKRTNQTAGWKDLDDKYLYANKAGGIIMSVAVEEMLHMSLSSNILYAIGGEPQLYLNSLQNYPTVLPHHRLVGPSGPDGETNEEIPLAKFSYEQLWHFLQIEYPAEANAPPEDDDWETIGQFYAYIKCLINADVLTDADFQVGHTESQIQPDNYSPNNIDTAHPTKAFDPWVTPPAQGATCPSQTGYPGAAQATRFSNAADSHTGATALITIDTKFKALEAITTICDQGEGYTPNASEDPTRSADPTDTEDSHYYKFLTLQAQLERYPHHVEVLATSPQPPKPVMPTITDDDLAEIIVNYPDNPTTDKYPKHLQPLSDLCNGIYQYMLIMTETIYRVPPAEQKLFFNEGMHRSMIWVLDKFIQAMRGFDAGEGRVLAPTFENQCLGDRKDAYGHLIRLCDEVTDCEQRKAVGYIIDTIKNGLPDVSKYWTTELS